MGSVVSGGASFLLLLETEGMALTLTIASDFQVFPTTHDVRSSSITATNHGVKTVKTTETNEKQRKTYEKQ